MIAGVFRFSGVPGFFSLSDSESRGRAAWISVLVFVFFDPSDIESRGRGGSVWASVSVSMRASGDEFRGRVVWVSVFLFVFKCFRLWSG